MDGNDKPKQMHEDLGRGGIAVAAPCSRTASRFRNAEVAGMTLDQNELQRYRYCIQKKEGLQREERLRSFDPI